MATTSKNAIVAVLTKLRHSEDIPGIARVRLLDNNDVIEINFDERKYIGRVRLEWAGDRYTVYMVDKDSGKIKSTTAPNTKHAYLSIKTAADARKFNKWYILTTQLAAMSRPRS
jgi:hypothetical protein